MDKKAFYMLLGIQMGIELCSYAVAEAKNLEDALERLQKIDLSIKEQKLIELEKRLIILR